MSTRSVSPPTPATNVPGGSSSSSSLSASRDPMRVGSTSTRNGRLATGAPAHRSAADRATRHTIVAAVTDDSAFAPRPYEAPFLTDINWMFNGAPHTGEVATSFMRAGEPLSIWIDANGDLTTQPLTDQHAATEAVITGFGWWFISVGIAAGGWTLLRLRLNQTRYATWDRELDRLEESL